MRRFKKFKEKLAKRLRAGVEVMTVAVFVVETFLERFGDPGFVF